MKKKKQPVQISIVNNNLLFSSALKALLEAKTDLHISVEITGGHRQASAQNASDILLLDLSKPDILAMKALKTLTESGKKAKIIILGGSANQEEVAGFFEQGACGFVDRESASHVLIDAIKAVMAGKYWIGDKAVSRLSERFKKPSKPPSANHQSNYGLTPRELDVIKAIICGRTNREIAGSLAISEQTVKHHITNIFDKLGVYNRLELTLFVFHHGLVEG